MSRNFPGKLHQVKHVSQPRSFHFTNLIPRVRLKKSVRGVVYRRAVRAGLHPDPLMQLGSASSEGLPC